MVNSLATPGEPMPIDLAKHELELRVGVLTKWIQIGA